MAEVPTVSVTIERERKCAEFIVSDRKIYEYIGTYHEEDVRMHKGAIFHERNFLDLIESSHNIPGSIEAFTGVPCEGHATVRVVVNVVIAGTEYNDEIAINCDLIKVDACEHRARQSTHEIAKLREYVAQLEERIANQNMLTEYCAQYGAFPRAGYRFCMEMFRLYIRAELPTFPMIGCMFIRIGNTVYECDDSRAFAGFKRKCIVACAIPQTEKGDRVGALGIIHGNAACPRFADDSYSAWLLKQYIRAIRKRSIAFMDEIESAQSIIGDEVRGLDPMYLAMPSTQSGICVNDSRDLPAGFIKIREISVALTEACFGCTIPSEMFTICHNMRYGPNRRTITDEFDHACATTLALEALAIESGMKPWNGRCGFGSGLLPAEGWL